MTCDPVDREALAIDRDSELDLAVEATPRATRDLRMQLGRWLRSAGAAPTVADDVGLAVYEALANAAEHAYPPDHPDPVVHLRARLDGTQVYITISDHGVWSSSDEPGYRGRGLPMMRHLVSEVQVDPTPQGTVVVLRSPLTDDSEGGGT